jgi:hypothetical protein
MHRSGIYVLVGLRGEDFIMWRTYFVPCKFRLQNEKRKGDDQREKKWQYTTYGVETTMIITDTKAYVRTP